MEGQDGKGRVQAAADSRFAAMHNDPRFQRFPKQNQTLVVDKRFAAMFDDPDFQSRSTVDKRGRKIDARRRNEDMRRYYRLKDEDEWRQEGAIDGEGAHTDTMAAAEDGTCGPAPRETCKKASRKPAMQQQQQQLEAATVVSIASRKQPQQQMKKQQTQVKAKGQGGEGNAAQVTARSDTCKREEGRRAEGGGDGRPAQRAAKGQRAGGAVVAGGSISAPKGKVVEAAGEDDVSSDGMDEEDEEVARVQERWARARGMLGSESSDDEEDEDGSKLAEDEDVEYDSADEPLTDEDESDEQLDVMDWGAGALALNPDEAIPQQEETRRLALVDLDWDHVRAVDLLVALRSFLPRGAALERVTVYPSDYGLQRMAEEAVFGPQLKPNQWGKGGKGGGDKEGGAAAGTKEKSGAKKAGGGKEEEEGPEVDKKRLAAYEKSRLRYYYAIAQCDCVATALHLYNECDGMEFERSACRFDLRFVPDDQSFEGRTIRDSATDMPPGYQPPADFNTSVQHTDPKLSWDAEDKERKRKLQGRRLKTDEQVLEADFAAYLASEEEDDDEEEDTYGNEGRKDVATGSDQDQGNGGVRRGGGKEDAEALRRRYRALLLGDGATVADVGKTKGRVGGKTWLGTENGEIGDVTEDDNQERDRSGAAGEPSTSGRGGRGAVVAANGGRGHGGAKGKSGDVDMVVTFHGGLEGLGERLKKKKEEERTRAGETVWEAYLRKKQEKRALRKAQGRLRKLSDSEDSEDYISDGDDGGAGAKGKSKKAAGKRDGNDHVDVASDDPFFQHDDNEDPFTDPFFNQDGDAGGVAASDSEDEGGAVARRGPKDGGASKGKKAAGNKAASAAERADLELLLMDDGALRDAARGVKSRVLPVDHDAGDSGKRKLTKKEKRELTKEAKRRARADSDEEDAAGGGEMDAAGFAVNLADPRFSDIFRNAEFALDPTDPRFMKMQARDKVLIEVQKQRTQQDLAEGRKHQHQNGVACNGTAGDNQERGDGAGAGGDLRIMVAKLKRKAEVKQQQERAKSLGKGPKKARL